ncbi:MAG: SRPBCC domain-containing protein [Kineosporiaceae bacterium]
MVPSTVEQEIFIEAPVEVVWRIITEPEHITQWFSDRAEVTPSPGGQGTLTFAIDATTDVSLPLTVVAAEPPHRFVYRWEYPGGEEPRDGNSLLVEFTLAPAEAGTLLRVVESGFDLLDRVDEAKAANAAEHVKGWAEHLARLQTYAPGQV